MLEDNYFLDVEVRALSIKQPYATLMLPPVCKVETRTWYTKWRGWVLICASQQHTTQWQQIETSGRAQLERMDIALTGIEDEVRIRCGQAIGIGQLVDCRPMTPADEDACYVQWKEGLWCHVFRDVHAITPFGHSGHLGYKSLDEYDKKKIVINSSFNPYPL
jgi:hypothetical protein